MPRNTKNSLCQLSCCTPRYPQTEQWVPWHVHGLIRFRRSDPSITVPRVFPVRPDRKDFPRLRQSRERSPGRSHATRPRRQTISCIQYERRGPGLPRVLGLSLRPKIKTVHFSYSMPIVYSARRTHRKRRRFHCPGGGGGGGGGGDGGGNGGEILASSPKTTKIFAGFTSR